MGARGATAGRARREGSGREGATAARGGGVRGGERLSRGRPRHSARVRGGGGGGEAAAAARVAAMADVEDVRAAFDDLDFELDAAGLAVAASLCGHYGLSADDLAAQWEAFAYNKGHKAVSSALLEELAEDIQRQKAKERAASGGFRTMDTMEFIGATTPGSLRTTTTGGSRRVSMTSPLPNAAAAIEAAAPAGAAPSCHKDGALAAAEHSPFAKRSGALGIMATLGAEAMGAPPADAGTGATETNAVEFVRVADVGLGADARFLYERLEDKVEYVQARIAAFEAALQAATSVSTDWPVYAATAGEEAVVVVGRIVVDGDEGRLNAASVLLEGSVRHSGGQRVKVGLDKLESFSLFPGQIVALEGHNPSGFMFMPTKVYAGVAPPAPNAAEGAGADASADVVVAAGPYTSPSDLGYEALDALLAYCAKARPSQLMLLGPFVDENHTAIKTGLIEVTFEELFRRQVLERCREALAGTGVRVGVAPSTRDVHSAPAFPQPPMVLPPAAASPAAAVDSLPNPALVRAGGLTLGACSADIIRQLAGEEVSKNPATKDRMTRLASHILLQRSFYPIYPAAIGSMLDTTHAAHFAVPARPDVLLLPSDIAPFAKLVGSDALGGTGAAVAAVNPGRLMKGPSGGTFARIRYAGSKEGAASAPSERTRVDILRI